jgi:hypothetical protein
MSLGVFDLKKEPKIITEILHHSRKGVAERAEM